MRERQLTRQRANRIATVESLLSHDSDYGRGVCVPPA